MKYKYLNEVLLNWNSEESDNSNIISSEQISNSPEFRAAKIMGQYFSNEALNAMAMIYKENKSDSIDSIMDAVSGTLKDYMSFSISYVDKDIENKIDRFYRYGQVEISSLGEFIDNLFEVLSDDHEFYADWIWFFQTIIGKDSPSENYSQPLADDLNRLFDQGETIIDIELIFNTEDYFCELRDWEDPADTYNEDDEDDEDVRDLISESEISLDEIEIKKYKDIYLIKMPLLEDMDKMDNIKDYPNIPHRYSIAPIFPSECDMDFICDSVIK